MLRLLAHLEQVAHTDLSRIENDELVVLHKIVNVRPRIRILVILFDDLAYWHVDTIRQSNGALWVRPNLADSMNAVLVGGELDLLTLRLPDFLRVAESDFAEKQQLALLNVVADILGRVGKAFCEGVSKIDALAEGMTSDRGLCGCDAHALLKDADEVEDGAAVEEEAAIADLAFDLLSFALALDAEDLQLVRLLVVSSLFAGLVAVLLDQVVLGAWCNADKGGLEAVADVIDRVQRAANGLVV